MKPMDMADVHIHSSQRQCEFTEVQWAEGSKDRLSIVSPLFQHQLSGFFMPLVLTLIILINNDPAPLPDKRETH